MMKVKNPKMKKINKGMSQEDEEMDESEESEDMEGAMQKYFPDMFQ